VNSGVASRQQIEALVRYVLTAKKLAVTQENFNKVLASACHLAQEGATSPKFAENRAVSILWSHSFFGELRDACKKANVTVRKLARGLKDEIIKVATRHRIEGNLSKMYKIENLNYSPQELVWVSDFQTFNDNPAMPEPVRIWLLENCRNRFKPNSKVNYFSALPNRFSAIRLCRTEPLLRFGFAKPLLRFGFGGADADASTFRLFGFAEPLLRFSALPNRFFASALAEPMPMPPLFGYSALPNRTASPLFGFAKPLLRFSALPNRFFAEAERSLRRSGAKPSPKRSEAFTEAERSLRQSGAKPSPKRSEAFAKAERTLRQSGRAKPSPKQKSEAFAEAEERRKREEN
jgi:hypothetical protein